MAPGGLGCDALRAAFAVGSAEGFPFDVWALFTSQREAQRHADGAAYVFGVFVLPVYEDYCEVPRALRPPWKFGTRLKDRASDETTLTRDALTHSEIEPVAPGPVVAVGDFESTTARQRCGTPRPDPRSPNAFVRDSRTPRRLNRRFRRGGRVGLCGSCCSGPASPLAPRPSPAPRRRSGAVPVFG